MHKQLHFHDCFTSYVVILTALTGPPSQVLSFVAPIAAFALLGADVAGTLVVSVSFFGIAL
jgi:hypothetical protein